MVRFCCNFKRDHKYMDIIDEINIVPYEETAKDLEIFLEKHQKQRINLCIPASYRQEEIKELKNVKNRKNLCVRFEQNFNLKDNQDILDFLTANNIPYYSKLVADDWDKFNGLAAAGVCDIYVGNSLGFQMKDVHSRAAVLSDRYGYKINIRVYPNVAQSSWNDTESIKKFFVRPEDAMEYSKYVDCFEFYELPDSPLTNTEVLYEIYKFDKNWRGSLMAIIMFLNEDIDNRFIEDELWQRRINCSKRCVYDDNCHICNNLIEMTEKLSDKELMMHRFLTKKTT